jgi:hypothetical protein
MRYLLWCDAVLIEVSKERIASISSSLLLASCSVVSLAYSSTLKMAAVRAVRSSEM